MKRFDFANEVAKQLITISSAIITVVIAFYDKFFSHSLPTYIAVFFVLLFFIASVIAGVFSIGGLTNSVERQEYNDWSQAGANRRRRAPFVRLNNSSAQLWAKRQQILFMVGLALFVIIGILDRAWLASFATEPTAKILKLAEPIIWTQVRPDTDSAKGELIARAIVARDAPCPMLTVDGVRRPMATRTDGSDPDFAIRMCEAAIPGATKAQFGDVPLKPRPRSLRKILVIGDTGCRITDYTAQACDNATEWPFFRVAKAASAHNPDLIIHVGDYQYREKPCAGRTGCAASPYGDNWATWRAEFFTPAAPLLTAAPWLMMRGNHENCPRAGAGWNLLIRPQLGLKAGESCPPDADPDVFNFGALRLLVPDTASAGDDYAQEARVATYRGYIRKLADTLKTGGGESWLLTHQALWVSYAIANGKFDTQDPFGRVPTTLDPALRTQLCQQIVSPIDTFRQWFYRQVPMVNPNGSKPEQPCHENAPAGATLAPPTVSLVLSGDTHTFQMFKPDAAQPKQAPIQLIVGNGGDALERNASYPGAESKLIDSAANLFGVNGRLWMRNTFGFAVLEKPEGAPAWTATVYDPDGKAIVHCVLVRDGKGCDEPRP